MKKNQWKTAAPTYLIFVLFALIWLLPIGTAFVKSFQINGIGNYQYVLSYDKISYFRVVFNSMFIAVGTAVLVTLITTLAAFAFSKMEFFGGRLLYGAVLACLAVPVAAVTSPPFCGHQKFWAFRQASGGHDPTGGV